MSKIIEKIAELEVGTKESPLNSNKTKYGEWFKYQGVPWCAIFVSWCYDQAKFPLKNLGFVRGFAGCQSAYAYFKKSGEIIEPELAKSGDIVLFDWNHDGRYDHTGLFVKDNLNGTFETIEGNTAIGNDSNGGEVMRRTRSYDLAVVFIHPKILDK